MNFQRELKGLKQMLMLCTLVHVHCAPSIGTVIFSLRLWMNVWFLFSILLQWCLRCCYFEAIVPHFVPLLRIISLIIISDRIFTCIYEINCVVRFFFASSIKYMRNMEKNRLLLWNSQSTLNRGDNASYDKRWLAPWDIHKRAIVIIFMHYS